jgi:hypothetical protein
MTSNDSVTLNNKKMKTLSEAMQMMGGIFLWIQIFIILLILGLSLRNMIMYYGRREIAGAGFAGSHHAVLFLGVFGFVWGMFTQLVGLVQALNAIIEAADVSPALIITGLRNSFINPVIGVATGILAALFWVVLHVRYSKLAAGKVQTL